MKTLKWIEESKKGVKYDFYLRKHLQYCFVDSQIYINITREDSVFSLLNTYNDVNFEITKKLIIADMQLVMI